MKTRMKRGYRLCIRGAGVCLLLGIVAAVVFSGGTGAESRNELWPAIVKVESGGNPHAYNPNDGATGIVQIRSVCLEDVNRIARLRGLQVQYSESDRFRPAAARHIWDLYLDYYGDQYQKETGRSPTAEVYARIWNGGPSGWKKESTVEYWRRVRTAM
jgi:hypothetical protein